MSDRETEVKSLGELKLVALSRLLAELHDMNKLLDRPRGSAQVLTVLWNRWGLVPPDIKKVLHADYQRLQQVRHRVAAARREGRALSLMHEYTYSMSMANRYREVLREINAHISDELYTRYLSDKVASPRRKSKKSRLEVSDLE